MHVLKSILVDFLSKIEMHGPTRHAPNGVPHATGFGHRRRQALCVHARFFRTGSGPWGVALVGFKLRGAPSARAILMHGFVWVDAKFEKRCPQPSFGNCGGLAIKKSTDPAQAVTASTVKPSR